MAPRLERAIGVVYRPETELQSHYFQRGPAARSSTSGSTSTRRGRSTPLEAEVRPGLPETYPFGL